MLVLTRKPGEVVVITTPDGTEIRVRAELRKGGTKLVFDAPDDVVIDRLEVFERKQVKPS